jgi:hypothetical protein
VGIKSENFWGKFFQILSFFFLLHHIWLSGILFSVVVDIRNLKGNIKISTVKNFYNGVNGSKVSTINQINAWVANFNKYGLGLDRLNKQVCSFMPFLP